MPVFSVHLLFSISLTEGPAPVLIHELSIYVLYAQNEEDAMQRGKIIGEKKQHKWQNDKGEDVHYVFLEVAEIQELVAPKILDGMEVSSWMWEGEKFDIEKRWLMSARFRG